LKKLPWDFEVRGHCMCKEMPVISVERVVEKQSIMGKMEGRGGREAQGVSDPKNSDPWDFCKQSWSKIVSGKADHGGLRRDVRAAGGAGDEADVAGLFVDDDGRAGGRERHLAGLDEVVGGRRHSETALEANYVISKLLLKRKKILVNYLPTYTLTGFYLTTKERDTIMRGGAECYGNPRRKRKP
jgi:hypothetical protein